MGGPWALVGFLHGTDADVGDFGGARQAERVGHHFGDVLRLREIRWASVATEPRACACFATSSSSPRRRATRQTSAPCPANERAMALPMPLLAPVTTAI